MVLETLENCIDFSKGHSPNQPLANNDECCWVIQILWLHYCQMGIDNCIWKAQQSMFFLLQLRKLKVSHALLDQHCSNLLHYRPFPLLFSLKAKPQQGHVVWKIQGTPLICLGSHHQADDLHQDSTSQHHVFPWCY